MVLATTISQAAVGAHAVVSTRLTDSGTGKRFTSPGRTTYYVDSATGNDGGAGTSIHGAWKTIERVHEPIKTWGVFTPTNRTTVDSFFGDRCVFVHAFHPVTTRRIRLFVHNATYGGGASNLVPEAGGQANGAPVYHLREVEIYGR